MIHVCVLQGEEEELCCPVFRAWANPMAWDVCFCKTGLFWLSKAVYIVSLHLAFSKFPCCPWIQVLIWRCDLVFSALSSTSECSQQHQMNPRQGFPQGNVLCTQLESVGGNSEPPFEVPIVKIQATDKSFLHLVQWIYLMLLYFWEAPLRQILWLKIS